MRNLRYLCVIFLALTLSLAGVLAQTSTGAIHGVMTDDSGAIVPAAPVTLAGKGAPRTAQTQADGTYTFTGVAPGDYTVNVTFPGFAPVKQPVAVRAGSTLDVPIRLAVQAERQQITVAGEAGATVSVEPDNNATALVLRGEDLAALPDDPDD